MLEINLVDGLSRENFEAMAIDPQIRKAIAAKSALMFFYMYFPHYAKYAIADYQREIFKLMQDDTNRLAVITAFRGSGKSTLLTMTYSLWAILGVQQKKLIVIVCQTQDQAKQHIMNIKYEAESNPMLKSDLGPIKMEEIGGSWTVSSLEFANGAKIMAVSVEQSIRGIRHKEHRPDLIILDDIEDINSTRTYDGRNKIANWYAGEIVPIGDLETRIIFIGNLLHEDSLIMNLRKKIESKNIKGISLWIPLIDDFGNCLWKEKFTNQEMIEDLRLQVGNERLWNSEYLLRIVSDKDQVIKNEWIKYYDCIPFKKEGHIYMNTFVGVDLAISEKEKADKTAVITVHTFGYGNDMKIYVEAYPINEHLEYSDFVTNIQLISKKHSRPKIFIENNGFQDIFVQMIKSKDRNILVEGITSKADKRTRLALISDWVKSGKILFPKTGCKELIVQLLGFGTERYDDLVDAFSLVIGQAILSKIDLTPFSLSPLKEREAKYDFEGREITGKPITRGYMKKIF